MSIETCAECNRPKLAGAKARPPEPISYCAECYRPFSLDEFDKLFSEFILYDSNAGRLACCSLFNSLLAMLRDKLHADSSHDRLAVLDGPGPSGVLDPPGPWHSKHERWIPLRVANAEVEKLLVLAPALADAVEAAESRFSEVGCPAREIPFAPKTTVTQADLEYACSNDVQSICARAGAIRLGDLVLKMAGELIESRASMPVAPHPAEAALQEILAHFGRYGIAGHERPKALDPAASRWVCSRIDDLAQK